MLGRQTITQPHRQIKCLLVVHRFKCSLHAHQYTILGRRASASLRQAARRLHYLHIPRSKPQRKMTSRHYQSSTAHQPLSAVHSQDSNTLVREGSMLNPPRRTGGGVERGGGACIAPAGGSSIFLPRGWCDKP